MKNYLKIALLILGATFSASYMPALENPASTKFETEQLEKDFAKFPALSKKPADFGDTEKAYETLKAKWENISNYVKDKKANFAKKIQEKLKDLEKEFTKLKEKYSTSKK